MKIKEIKLIDANSLSMDNTGFRIRGSDTYELQIEEKTSLGFTASNTIEVPMELTQELHGYLNEFAKKCVDYRNQQMYIVEGTNGIKLDIDKHNAVTNQTI